MSDALQSLPMFATDKQIAIAIVGKDRADYWVKNVLPVLEGRDFPRVDMLHGGRPVPLVRQYYEAYLGVGPIMVVTSSNDEEDAEAWTQSRRSRLSKR